MDILKSTFNTRRSITAVILLVVVITAWSLSTTARVYAQTCYSENGIAGGAIDCNGPGADKLLAGNCYMLVDPYSATEHYEKIDCPDSTSAGDCDFTKEDLSPDCLAIQQIHLANQDTENIVKNNPIYNLLLDIINFLSAGVGLVVITMITIGGFQYMTANGNPQKTQEAMKRISNALIGLALYLFMFAILQWLIPGGFFSG
jgi:hypothetical protein